MKPTVVVTKSGTPAYVGGTATARGEGETSSVLQHLVDRGDLDVVYFGSCRGYEDWEPYTSGGLSVMDPSMTGIFTGNETPRFSDAATMAERIDPYIERLLARNVKCWVDLTGPEVSWSWPANDKLASCMLWSARYGGPAKYAMHKVGQKTGAPRYCVVTDPKCYPRDGEMTCGWPSLKPMAVLSQETTQFPRTIIGKESMVHAVYSGAEYWLTQGFPEVVGDKQWELAIAANAHLKDGRVGGKGKGRQQEGVRYQAWTEVLDQCDPEATRICGAGWDDHEYSQFPCMQQAFIGVLPDLQAVLKHIASGLGSPVLPQKRGFNTTKPRLHALCGSVPYLYSGSCASLHYDADQRILPAGHPARWVTGVPDLTEEQRQEAIALVLETTRPNFTLLDGLIDRTVEGTCDFGSDAWLAEFGGYKF